jgi:CBS domain containing-hemolysin-like protein
MKRSTAHRLARRAAAASIGAAAMCAAAGARASFLSGDTLDAAANVMAWVVLILVPIVLIVVFWLVHVMPEKLAYKRHHPQAQAIHTLCLLSLLFGGLLWPIAWLWTFTKPIGYKLAYGTEKHETFFVDAAEKARAGRLTPEERASLRHELDAMAARGPLPPHFQKLRDYLAEREAAEVVEEVVATRSA